jgi:GntR family transcriptional regulator, transcriptional repressor for pyruvate dehydrogenase complex
LGQPVKILIPDLKRVQRTSLSDGIVEQITGLIGRGVLKPGDRIPSEKQLCKQFGVGRTSVREALRSLSVMGILESHAGEGTFVSANSDRYLERAFQWGLLLDSKVIEDLVETRLMLESHTSYLAARKATDEDLEELEQAIRGMEQSISDLSLYLEHDLRFHLRIAQATQNRILETLLSTIRGYLQVWVQETLSVPAADNSIPRAMLSVSQHKQILYGLRKHEPEEARHAMREHILSSSADLRSRFASKTSA